LFNFLLSLASGIFFLPTFEVMGTNASSCHDQKRQQSKVSCSSSVQQTQTPPPTYVIETSPPKTPLKGILKNAHQKPMLLLPPPKPVKMVDLYVQRAGQWQVVKVREDEAEVRKKELKSDKSVNRIYIKPTHDTTYLHCKAF